MGARVPLRFARLVISTLLLAAATGGSAAGAGGGSSATQQLRQQQQQPAQQHRSTPAGVGGLPVRGSDNFPITVPNASRYAGGGEEVMLSGWVLYGADSKMSTKLVEPPSLVHIDLMKAGKLSDPFDGTNIDDAEHRWVMQESNWTYSATFYIASTSPLLLLAQGLDTVCSVRLNGLVIGNSSNMHVRTVLQVAAVAGVNTLSFSFADPVSYAKTQRAMHPCPCSLETCTDDKQHARPCRCCDFNATQYPIYSWAPGRIFVRKAQSHYGWNWGPATMPRGMFLPVSLLRLHAPVLEDVFVGVTPLTALPLSMPLMDNSTSFNVRLHLKIRSETAVSAGLKLVIASEWAGEEAHTLPELIAGTTSFTVDIKATQPMLWWPHELRPAWQTTSKLYTVNVSLGDARESAPSGHAHHGEFSPVVSRRIGFRVAELAQGPPTHGNGTLWQWKINGFLLYIRGANIIPFDALTTPDRVGRQQFKAVLSSATEASMNMVRIWGGGQYLSSEFYDEADDLGLLVWQEIAFACAIYPAHPEFAASVRAEIVHQTTRLSAHPSIVLWCGNNEAEQNSEMAQEPVWRQYKSLAYDVIVMTLRSQMSQGQANVELWPSSPSNGFQSTWSSPKDESRGDVHFYDYFGDCTDSSRFPSPRFQSEFGFPSYPQETELVARTARPTDTAIYSRFNIARQDLNCPLSNYTLEWNDLGTGKRMGCQLPMMQTLLPLPPGSWANQSIETWRHSLYAGQVAQALCVQAQAEHLRRGRDTAAQTSGSLFWQLNSEWPGGSKSSLQYDGDWKALHFFAKRFYAPFAASSYLLDHYRNYSVAVANDGRVALTVSWRLELWRYNESKPMRTLPMSSFTVARGSGKVALEPVRHSSVTHVHTNVSRGLFLRAIATASDGQVSYTFTPLGGRGLAGAEGLVHSASVALTVHPNRSVTLLADAVVPHAFLRLRPHSVSSREISAHSGRFSRNSLLLLPNQPITLDWIPGAGNAAPTVTVAQLEARLTVDCLNRVGGCEKVMRRVNVDGKV